MSCKVLFSAWPRCRAAVTLGGGMTIAYGSPGSLGSAWKSRSSIHTRWACGSTDLLSYALGSSLLMESLARDEKSQIANQKSQIRTGMLRGGGSPDKCPAGASGRTLSYDDRH